MPALHASADLRMPKPSALFAQLAFDFSRPVRCAPRCTSRWVRDRCELPRGHRGYHRAERGGLGPLKLWLSPPRTSSNPLKNPPRPCPVPNCTWECACSWPLCGGHGEEAVRLRIDVRRPLLEQDLVRLAQLR